MNKQQILQQFVNEATDHIARVEELLLRLENEPSNTELIHGIFQGVHGIKGTSDYTGLSSINRLSHELESLLNRLRNDTLETTPEVIDRVLKGVDLIKKCIDNVADPDHAAEQVEEFVASLRSELSSRSDSSARVRPVKPAASASSPRLKTVRPKTDMLPVFLGAAAQHIESLEGITSKLETDPTDAVERSALKRTIDTLRKSARYMNQSSFVDILDPLYERAASEAPLAAGDVASLRAECAKLRALHDQYSQGNLPPEPTETELAGDDESSEEDSAEAAVEATIRVSMRKLDSLMNLISELVVVKNSMSEVTSQSGEGVSSRELLRQLRITSQAMSKVTDEVQDQIQAIRLVPIRDLFSRFPRLVRDVARQYAKKAQVRLHGEETELDKSVADALHDPLVHLVRNALAHGLESPAERREAGKSETGVVTLRAASDGNSITVEVIDDGRGLDFDAIRAKAVRGGEHSAEDLAASNDAEITDLIFRPGLTTAATTDGLSGRGVGLDVVLTNVKGMGGTVVVDQESGAGTRFSLRIPLTLSLIQATIVEAAGQRFAIPSGAIEETLSLQVSATRRLNGMRAMIHRDEAVPLVDLGALVRDESQASEPRESLPTLLMQVGGHRIGLTIDHIHRQQDIVVKPLSAELQKHRLFSGATVMADGSLILILSPAGLI